MRKGAIAAAIGALVAASPMQAHAIPFADVVLSFSGGAGFGVVDLSGGAYGGASGSGVFDPLAVTAGLDGASIGLGGESGSPGVIVVKFSQGSVTDGAGSDVRFYDTFGASEGLRVEASADGLSFFSLGFFGGSGIPCSPGAPCASDFDLSGSGLSAASVFRVTVVQGNLGGGGGCVSSYPECYDLDAVEALSFSESEPVPEPGTIALIGGGLVGLAARRRRALNPPGRRPCGKPHRHGRS